MHSNSLTGLEISKLYLTACYHMDSDKIKKVQDLIDSGCGDTGRNEFILWSLSNDKKLYNTDIKYLESHIQKLDEKRTLLNSQTNTSKTKQSKRASVITDSEIDEILERQDKRKKAKMNRSANII